MRTFKRILAVIAGIVVILLIIGLFTRKEYSIEKEILVNRPAAEVFSYIRLLGNQKFYNTWVMKDPNIKIQNQGTDGAEGFVSSWESDESGVGKGLQKINDVKNGRIVYDIHFIEPFEGDAECYISAEPAGTNHTRVKWGFDSGMKYPMNIMMVFMDIPGMLGSEMEKSLANLKGNLEK